MALVVMWQTAARHTLPDAESRCFDAVVLYLLPYYAALHIQWITYIAPDLTFAGGKMSITSAGALGAVILICVGLSVLGLIAHQVWIYHKFRYLAVLTQY